MGRAVNTTPRPLYPREREPYPFCRPLGGPIWTVADNLSPKRYLIPGPSSFCPYFARLLYDFDRNGLLQYGAGASSTVVMRRAGRIVWNGPYEITFRSVHFP